MTKFTKSQAEAARKLAVAYAAFLHDQSDDSRFVWAKMLLDAQAETGVVLVKEYQLRLYREPAERRAA